MEWKLLFQKLHIVRIEWNTGCPRRRSGAAPRRRSPVPGRMSGRTRRRSGRWDTLCSSRMAVIGRGRSGNGLRWPRKVSSRSIRSRSGTKKRRKLKNQVGIWIHKKLIFLSIGAKNWTGNHKNSEPFLFSLTFCSCRHYYCRENHPNTALWPVWPRGAGHKTSSRGSKGLNTAGGPSHSQRAFLGGLLRAWTILKLETR